MVNLQAKYTERNPTALGASEVITIEGCCKPGCSHMAGWEIEPEDKSNGTVTTYCCDEHLVEWCEAFTPGRIVPIIILGDKS
jgi:hypothetical protein